MNAALILQLLIELLSQASSIANVIAQAQASGTDITQAQLDDIRGQYQSARAALDAAIAAATPKS